METMDKIKYMRLKNREYFNQYYHTHDEYRVNKNKNDNERNKLRYRNDPAYRKKTLDRSRLRILAKNRSEV